MDFSQIHSSFKLNGIRFNSKADLIEYVKTSFSSTHDFFVNWFNDEDYLIVQTSGSTGKPKPIKLLKEQMINSALATGAFFEIKENTTALLCMSVDYIAGKMMLVRAMVLGWDLDIFNAVSNPLSLTDKNYHFSAMVPLQLEKSLDQIERIDKLIVGGGVVSESLKSKILKVKTEIFATYGMTETITHIAVKKLNQLKERPSFYKVLPNVKIYIDQRNCLMINAPLVANEIVLTNDVVQLVSENEFEWLGRYDNVINSGGIKLHPEKIEHKLSKLIQNRFFTVGIKDERLGEKLVLVIENNATEINSEEVIKRINEFPEIKKYEVPKEIYFVKSFIETETKKVQRRKTMDLVLNTSKK
ncbi:O-succinylbenzoic acid--CoA ligase [Tenacibaculum sp. SZ-18]|uniref:AMP-binding protein n=1 Tax=Tenacibaculum sp. SZ-18 TaxID=754423 RepID=UPI000C2D0461|nr:AMP-binding protein [Tenacibaculum sp. SZ-18]AUC15511.1 O-succinylbenzoic acid--CoA ligase [Tenacibaculum sp. SZ-18]